LRYLCGNASIAPNEHSAPHEHRALHRRCASETTDSAHSAAQACGNKVRDNLAGRLRAAGRRRNRMEMINDTLVGIGDSIGPDAKDMDIKNDRVVIQIGEKTHTLRQ
jgi:hypothetical protein